MKKKPLSPAKKALVRSQVDTRVDIVEDIVSPIALSTLLGIGSFMLLTMVINVIAPDLAASLGIAKENIGSLWPGAVGMIVGASVGTKIAAPSINTLLQHRHPRLKRLDDPELAQVIDTALMELSAGFQWTYDEGRVGNGVLGIGLEGDETPMISVGLNVYQPQNPPLDMAESNRRNVYVNSDTGFATSLEYAASLLHDFFIATKHLSKDPVRVGTHPQHTVRITRSHQRHEDHDVVTGTIVLADDHTPTKEIMQVVILHDHTENVPARLVAALFPIWTQIHHKINHIEADKLRRTEQLGAQAAAEFLVDSALREVSRAPQPTDEDILRELG